MSDTRPIWLREEHAQRFVDIAFKLQRMDGMGDLADAQFLMGLSEMVDAAPADAVETVRTALAPLRDLDPVNGIDLVKHASRAALRSLGMPDASPTETEPHEHH